MDEKALVKACQKGDRQAFEALIRLFYPYVFRFLLKMTLDESLAEDLTQDTFLKMIQNIEQFDADGGALFGTWLIAIAKHRYIDLLRRNHEEWADVDSLQIADGHDMEANALRHLQYEDVREAISKLPKEQEIAIRLKYEEDLTIQEIAEQSGVPGKTIKSRIHEGTVKLRKLLRGKERENG